ncbi:hypothetical protein RJT34_19860 [Clitoria ternatea]|uniref:Uncharacterized protein n=1 Tax=Clitoria ternatea TaxID=43366 RepID=A0AAN9IS46_CLITE
MNTKVDQSVQYPLIALNTFWLVFIHYSSWSLSNQDQFILSWRPCTLAILRELPHHRGVDASWFPSCAYTQHVNYTHIRKAIVLCTTPSLEPCVGTLPHACLVDSLFHAHQAAGHGHEIFNVSVPFRVAYRHKSFAMAN